MNNTGGTNWGGITHDAGNLISEVFEKWETFDSGENEEKCPDCGIENKLNQEHQEWCWFRRASEWLKSNSMQVPSAV